MRIDCDPQAGALYIQLRQGEIVETLETNQYIYVDIDEEGRPLGIEMLFVSRHFALEDLGSVTFNILDTAQQVTALLQEDQANYDTDEE